MHVVLFVLCMLGLRELGPLLFLPRGILHLLIDNSCAQVVVGSL